MDNKINTKQLTEEQLQTIRGYFDREDRLTQLPSKKKKKMLVLYRLTEKLPEDGSWSEREFSMLLNTMHTFGDAATLRREMFDAFLINRSPEGQAYCVNPDRPFPGELLEKCK